QMARALAAFSAVGDEPGEIAALALAGLIASSRGANPDYLQIALRVAELPAARENLFLHVLTELVTATLAELSGDLQTALAAMARLPGPDTDHPMGETAARVDVALLVLAGRANEATAIADAALLESSHAHIRKTPPFVRWSAGDASDIEELVADDGPAPDTNARDEFFYTALSTYVCVSTGDADRFSELAELLDTMPVNTADARDVSMLAAAVSTRLIAWHDEDGARRALAAHLDRHPIDDPRCDVQLRRALASIYVCAPDLRPVWDHSSLGPCHQRMREAARAMLIAREADSLSGSDAEALTAALEDTDALMTMVPLALSVELAVRAHGHGLAAGVRAVELLRGRIGDKVVAELAWQREQGDQL